MNRRLPATRPTATRVIHYVEAATPAELTFPMNPAALAQKQRVDAQLYARWVERQAVLAERDRKVRRFLLGFGAVIAVAVLAVLAVVGWLIWQALAAISLGALAIPAVLALAALLGIGGHKCVTVVTHRH